MNWIRIRPWLGTLARLVLGVVWIIAAYDKLGDPRKFVQAVRAYNATPEWLSEAIGYGLPVLEMCLGILLVVGIATRIASAVSGALFLVFLVGIIQAAARGLQLECGCFGGGGTTTAGTTYTLDILRDVGLLILAVFLVLWPMTRISLEEFLARHDTVERPSAKRLRSEQGRRKYNAMLEARRRDAIVRNRWITASLAAVVVLVSLIGIGVQANRAKISGSLVAAHASVNNGVVFGKKAAATVDVYEDFQCPNCLHYEEDAGKTVEAAVRANEAQVRFHTMAFLSAYSSRAANAGLCASDVSVEDFYALHKILFTAKVQPAEGTSGLTNEQLVTYGIQAGIPKADQATFTTCVMTDKHKALVQAITDKASKDGVNATPTIKVNGKKIEPTAAAFTKAIDAAAKKGPKPDPSPSPATTSGAAGAAGTTPAPASGSSTEPKPSSTASASKNG